MIYGSHRDKNLHKLIRFCDRNQFFPIFGNGNCQLQPIHADDLAQAILATLQNPTIEGDYNLSGGSIVRFQNLISLLEKLLHKPIRKVFIPLPLGVGFATTAEFLLGERSPIRREQVLRLQEDKAYAHDRAAQDLKFQPRSLEEGLQQEIALLQQEGVISQVC